MTVSFGSYVCAFLCPPLYFALQKRWGATFAHSILYLLAILTIIFFVGFFFWFIGVVHAMWDLRSRMMESHVQRQAEVIAQKMGPLGAPR